MDLLKFAKRAIDLDKEEILVSIEKTMNEITTNTIPAYANSVTVFGKNYVFKSKELEQINKSFMYGQKIKYPNMFMAIQDALPKMVVKLEILEKLYNERASSKLVGTSLTYFQSNIIQLAEYCDFAAKYSRKLLQFAYILESKEEQKTHDGVDKIMSTPVANWVRSNIIGFSTIINILAKDKHDFDDVLNKIPNVAISQDTLDAINGIKEKDVDPFSLNFLGINLHPVYFVRKLITQWSVAKHEEAKADYLAIELRKQYLENLIKKNYSPATEKELNALSQMQIKIAKKISEFEEEVYGNT